MQIKFTIPYPPTNAGKTAWNKQYGMNAIYAGKHWSQRKEDAKDWHLLTWAALRKAHLIPGKPLDKPVVITYLFNDSLDSTNHGYMVKMIEDALIGRVIKGDSRKYVRGTEIYFHDLDCIKVIVTEVEKP